MSPAADTLNIKKQNDCIILLHHFSLRKNDRHNNKEQLLSNFLENSGNFGQLLRKSGTTCGWGYSRALDKANIWEFQPPLMSFWRKRI